jgi:uncharacterized protein YndB with AHSA1/START domain
MRPKLIAILFATVLAQTGAGNALDLKETIAIDAAPGAVWKLASDFCGIAGWHPAYRSCTLSEITGKKRRMLVTTAGTRIVERLLTRDDEKMVYTYRLEFGPMPVKNFVSTFLITAAGGGAEAQWSAKFEASGVSEDAAKALVGELLRRGLGGLKSKF